MISCISRKFPISTREPSIFIPTCSLPEAIMAGVTVSEGLMEATSNEGVCPNRDPAASSRNMPQGHTLERLMNVWFTIEPNIHQTFQGMALRHIPAARRRIPVRADSLVRGGLHQAFGDRYAGHDRFRQAARRNEDRRLTGGYREFPADATDHEGLRREDVSGA